MLLPVSQHFSGTYHRIENGIPPAPSIAAPHAALARPLTTLKEALHVSIPLAPRFPPRVRAGLPGRLRRWHGGRGAGDRRSLLVRAPRSILAEGLKPQTFGGAAKASTEDCRCTPTAARLRRVARAARCADEALSIGPVPLESILKVLPRSAGPGAVLILQAMSAGASLCDLIADEVESHAGRAVPCRRCARGSRVHE